MYEREYVYFKPVILKHDKPDIYAKYPDLCDYYGDDAYHILPFKKTHYLGDIGIPCEAPEWLLGETWEERLKRLPPPPREKNEILPATELSVKDAPEEGIFVGEIITSSMSHLLRGIIERIQLFECNLGCVKLVSIHDIDGAFPIMKDWEFSKDLFYRWLVNNRSSDHAKRFFEEMEIIRKATTQYACQWWDRKEQGIYEMGIKLREQYEQFRQLLLAHTEFSAALDNCEMNRTDKAETNFEPQETGSRNTAAPPTATKTAKKGGRRKANKARKAVLEMQKNGDIEQSGNKWKDLVNKYSDILPKKYTSNALRALVDRMKKEGVI